MGKIPNWSRRKDIEGRTDEYANKEVKIIRAWQNDNNNAIARLRMFKYNHEQATQYELTVSEDRKFYNHKNQGEAITQATDWLEEHQYSSAEIPDDSERLHSKLLEVGREVEPDSQGVGNDLSDREIETIVSTVAFFDRKGLATKQTQSDLTPPTSYRVFDWLGMMMDTDLDSDNLNWLFEKLAEIYIHEKDVDGFINQLRMRDLQVEMPDDLERPNGL
jgi:hypothetical protein